MRAAFTIAILLLAVIGSEAQCHYSPAYYPAEIKLAPECTPSAQMGPFQDDFAGHGTWWQRNKKGIYVTGIQLASIVLDASGDAIYDMGKESGNSSQMTLGHTLQATAIGGMGVTMASLVWKGNVWDGVRFGVSYVAMRYAIFDLSYNLARGIDPLYADGIKSEMPPGGRVFTQTIFFGFSISINFKKF